MKCLLPKFIILIIAVLAATKLNSQFTVKASAETDPVLNAGDAADDPAIWVHPFIPDSSFIVGTDKTGNGRLELYNLDGSRFFASPAGARYNNVDVHYNFLLDDEYVDLVCASNRSDNSIEVFKVNAVNRTLENVTGFTSTSNVEPYGFTLHRSPVDGNLYAFISARNSGDIGQFELVDGGSGEVDAVFIRILSVSSKVEGMVADDALGFIYFSEENIGIWKFNAHQSGGSNGVLIDSVNGPNIAPQVEGITLYYASDSTGYLIQSLQGPSEFAVYERQGNNNFIGRFSIIDGAIGGTFNTDGVAATSYNLGSNFPNGLFVAHDNNQLDSTQNSNFKLVNWDSIAAAMSLDVNNAINPRCFHFQTQIAALQTENIKTRSAQLRWLTVPCATHYTIRGNEIGMSGFVEIDVMGGEVDNLSVNGLQANTSYFWKVKAHFENPGAFHPGWSELDTFSTRCAKPSQIWTSTVTDSSAILHWLPLADVSGYEIFGKEAGAGNWLSVQLSNAQTGFEAIGLNPATSYVWKIRAICGGFSNMKSKFSAVDTFQTISAKKLNFHFDSYNDLEWNFQIFPNPVQDLLRIDFQNLNSKKIELTLLGASNQLLLKKNFEISNQNQECKLKLSQFSSGVYFLKVKTEKQIRFKKLIIN